MGEAGYKKLDLEFWHMLLAPAGTPAPSIHRVNAALRHALADAKVTDTFAKATWSFIRPTNGRLRRLPRCSGGRSTFGAT